MFVDGWDGVNVYDLLGLDRNDGAERLGLTEVLGLPEFIDGLDRSTDGLDLLIEGTDRLNEGLGRLLIDGPGLAENDLDRVEMRFCRLPPGAIALGADGITAEGLRLIWGLGAARNDGRELNPPRFIICGCERICGAGDMRGAMLGAFCREAAPPENPRDRD